MKIQITPIDEDAVVNGKEHNYLGVKLLVARANNAKFLKKIKFLSEQHRDGGRLKHVSDEKINDIAMKAMAGTVLVGWEPFKVGDELVEFSEENAYNLLKNDSDARESVSGFANNLDNFLVAQEEELLGESA